MIQHKIKGREKTATNGENATQESKKTVVPVSDKYMLTIREASIYFSIGEKKLRRLAEEHTGDFAVINGNRYLIIRTKFEQFLLETSTI
ncbi:excisionase [Ruminococcus sp. XPD3002]|uniref:excisionase n=1 Tax=Ruminococcus sp. XPD3002 TaxID=1452269 RepID=UPI0009195AEE|nr:DNA binding domain-containing protein, excisionase family [Ruminococcus flavefaciens]